MFGFVKQIFVSAIMFFGCHIAGVYSLKCVSMSNKERKIKPEVININRNEPSFHPYSVEINKCSDSCNNINNPNLKLCVPHVLKT